MVEEKEEEEKEAVFGTVGAVTDGEGDGGRERAPLGVN